jgi:hypothetical protein
MTYTYQDFEIPEYMMPGLMRWIEEGVTPGDFLQAVLRNDLRAACEQADNTNKRNLPAYIAFLYNHAPSACWGSDSKVDAWPAYREAVARQTWRNAEPKP